jgi:hypothetical protein
VLAATALVLAACSASSSGSARPAWTEVKGLGHVVAVAAPSGQAPWLLGGGVIGPDGVNHVAIWSALGPAGPWVSDKMTPVAGRDGPNETIQGFGTGAGTGPPAAVGSRPSPSEGYPRPSTWVVAPGPPGAPSWQEVLASRELFGGPNVVSIGAMGAGPHGYFIAGTWLAPDNHVVAAVWHSGEGLQWVRHDTDPAFDAGPATQSYAFTVADGPSGILLGGTTATPTPADPTREVGTLWHSTDGDRWARLAGWGDGGRSVVRAVQALGTGWVAAGQVRSQPATWVVDAGLHTSRQPLPGASGTTVDDLTVTTGAVLAAGLKPDGAIVIWEAPRRGDQLGGWRPVVPPPAGPGWSGARLAAAGKQLVVVAFNATGSEVWQAA